MVINPEKGKQKFNQLGFDVLKIKVALRYFLYNQLVKMR